MQKILPPRAGDRNLDKPPRDVVISLFMLGNKHWSECIVEDRRPPAKQEKP